MIETERETEILERSRDDGKVSGCLFCKEPLRTTFVDLGMHPLCESYVGAAQLNQMEPFYPLHVFVCERCFLVQLQEYVSPADIFTEYAYFSSYSDSWVQHAKRYTNIIVDRLSLTSKSFVVEVASNDGYLLQHFVAKGIPVLGIEPAENVAKVAIQKAVPTLVRFFGQQTARDLVAEGKQADLVIGNNVLAQVPDLNDFVAGIKILLAPGGVVTMEFPHLLRLMKDDQFDTIYHEHFFYFSFFTVEQIFAAHGLTLFDVEQLSTHGGSLRIYAGHKDDKSKPISPRVASLKNDEASFGVTNIERYRLFGERVKESKRKILECLVEIKNSGKSIVGYGAPGKGNTLLNYCGIRTDFLDYTVDRNPYKQGKYTPGTHIPIYPPERIRETKPDYLFILPWNLKNEIMDQMAYVREWGGKFIVPIPLPRVFD
jgi:SAM-dependent methyltransferase